MEDVIKIDVKDNNVEQALRVLKRKLQRDGFFKIVKLKSNYEKPSEKKLKKYVPLSKRQDKPDSVLWLIKNHSQLKDSQIAKLVGITKNSVVAIRNKSYWNFNSLNPKDPVAINLFSQKELTEALEKAERRIKREKKLKEKAQKQNIQTG